MDQSPDERIPGKIIGMVHSGPIRITVRAGRLQHATGRRCEELVILKERFDQCLDAPPSVELVLQAVQVLELIEILQEFADSYRSDTLDRYYAVLPVRDDD